MKKTIKLFGFIALAAIIGFTMTACPDEPDDDPSDPTQLRLSNMTVFFEDETAATDFGYIWDYIDEKVAPLGDLITGTPKAQITGTGTGRKLDIELDAPYNVFLESIVRWLAEGVTATPDNTKILVFDDWFNTSSGEFILHLDKPVSNCYLLYVDRSVKINGGTGNFRYENVSLEKGWHFLSGTWADAVCTLTASKTPPAGFTWTVSRYAGN
jgi:hypothetical protein